MLRAVCRKTDSGITTIESASVMRRRQRFNAPRKNALCFMAASCNRTLGVGILQQTEYHVCIRSDRTIARSSSRILFAS